MLAIVVVPPRGRGVTAALDALARRETVLFRDLRRRIAIATFYDRLIPLVRIVNRIAEKHCGTQAILIETTRDPITGRPRMALRREPGVKIERVDGYIVVTGGDARAQA